MIFKLKIWDRHEVQVFEDGEKVIRPHEDEEWHTFNFGLETDRIRIDYFREYVLFSDGVPQPCVKIFLSDNTGLFGKYTYATFEKYYNEVYLPMIPKNLIDIVEDLKGE